MAGIGSYKKGKAFTLKSGNKPSFKRMGSSPAKHGTTSDFHYGKNGHNPDIMDNKHEDFHAMQAEMEKGTPKPSGKFTEGVKKQAKKIVGDKTPRKKSPAKHPHTERRAHGTYGHNTDTGKSVAEGGKARPDNPNYVPPKKKSPAKTHEPGHKKGASVSDFDDTVAYTKKKEELLNQGFTQKDADQMIKSGAVTGKRTMTKKLTTKPAYVKTIQNKKAKGGKLTKAEKRQLDEYRIHVTEQNK